ncbi:endonuclease [Yoonia algicola]|uniref:Endonuclease n=1 Tax=Yoonia algicola TaxID=3137368 RepID=A0AAN0M0E8_9RHOB
MLSTVLKLLGAIALAVITLVGCQTIRNSGNTPLQEPTADTLRVATYNVHYIILSRETGAWSVADWDRRKTPLDLAFKEMTADVIGFQEMESFAGGNSGSVNLTLDWLLKNNPDYAAAAVGDPSIFPSTQPILYRANRLRLLDQGWFFFSDTPDVIYSSTFNGSYPAFASWAQFRDLATGTVFRVVNLHTDYGSRSNRMQSVELVAKRVAPWIAAGETLFLVGDINARFGDPVLEVLEETGLTFAPVEGSTYHLNWGLNLFSAIDHIAHIGDAIPVSAPVVLRQKFAGEWPTDHYPVIVDYQLGGAK